MLKYFFTSKNRPFFALALLCLCGTTQAAELRWYDVEVIAFAHARGEYLNTETWPAQWPEPNTEKAIDFEQVKHSLFAKKRPQGSLKGSAKRIQQSSRYKLLSYQAWRQAGLKKTRAKPVRLQSEASVSALVPGGEDEYGNPISTRIALPQLDGSVTISLGRFLHIDTDLLYRAALENVEVLTPADSAADSPVSYSRRIAAQDSDSAQIQGFHMQSHRKTRSKETQFIDHPMFGLIVRITPVKTS